MFYDFQKKIENKQNKTTPTASQDFLSSPQLPESSLAHFQDSRSTPHFTFNESNRVATVDGISVDQKRSEPAVF
jgi:hypothetical protein